MLLAGASDEVPDKQGRVTIPAGLRDYAGLERDCAVIGASTRVEIWDAAAWEAYLAEQEPASPTLRGGAARGPSRPPRGPAVPPARTSRPPPARPSWRTFPGARAVVSSGRGPGRTTSSTSHT